MKNQDVAKHIKNYLKAQHPSDTQVYRFPIEPLSDSSLKARTIYVTGIFEDEISNIENGLHDFFEEQNLEYELQPTEILTIDTMEKSISEPQSNLITNTWRCRLYLNSNDILAHIKNKTLMKSKWRILVSKQNNEYFSRYEIYPNIWIPSVSTVGKNTFSESIINIFDNLYRSDGRILDMENDFIECWANNRDAGEKKYTRVLDEIKVKQFKEQYDSSVQNVIDSFNKYFGTIPE